MSEDSNDSTAGSFVKIERVAGERGSVGALGLNLRLFGSLGLFLKLLPLTIVTIVLSSAAPSYFRWFCGKCLEFPERFRLATLLWVTLGAVFFRIAAWACFEVSGMWSSRGIHDQMVLGMSGARTTFFDENPTGRLINRLVRDYDEVRSTAIIFVGDLINAGIEVICVGVVASLATLWAIPALGVLLGGFLYIQFQRSAMLGHSRSLSSVAFSQVISRETDLIEGREIFLLYGKSDRLLERLKGSLRKYIQASALNLQIDVWSSLWIRVFSEFFSLCVLIFTCIALVRGQMDATLAGVVISCLFGITGSIGWLDFAAGQVSRSAPHLRRVYEFVDLPKEEDEERAQPLAVRSKERVKWELGTGDIAFRDFTMSYRKDTPLILEGLDLEMPGGMKTALVGRTGSGKTSIVQSLLRMVYVHGGDIRIGGSSIYDWDLRELRALFGVVPQFPYLFSGNLRANLDRSGDLETRELERALGAVGLHLSLDHPVTEGGQNLSQGERQLVCLARVLAAGRKIVVMDEPTSGLDPVTDAKISSILRVALREKTVLTIAHRRESLGSYDKVVELSEGKVVWTGSSARYLASR